MNLGVDSSYGRVLQLDSRMRARGLQHAVLGRSELYGTSASVGAEGNTYVNPMSLSKRLISRGKERVYFGIGNDDKPWYESFFAHVERVAPLATSFVINIMTLRGAQRSEHFRQANAQEREMAYFGMFQSMVGQQSGQGGKMDQQTQQFLFQQLQNEPAGTRNQIYNNAAGGDPNLANALRNMMEKKPWYEKPVVWAGILGTVFIGGVVYVAATKD